MDLRDGIWREMVCLTAGSVLIFIGVLTLQAEHMRTGAVLLLLGFGLFLTAYPLQTRRHRRFFRQLDSDYEPDELPDWWK